MRTLGFMLTVLSTMLVVSGPGVAGAAEPAAELTAEHSAAAPADAPGEPPAEPKLTMGNGDLNWIVTAGATRDGATFTFREVRIKGSGWLVMHGFKDGEPVSDSYVGATYLEDGATRNATITVDAAPKPGDMYIVMLHHDVNENREFDFVFVDERNVLDKAVFEGTKMIAHPFVAPE
jgi:hypothetical protein